jgi:bifunctional non-homologous end joining protein LigD
MSWEKIRDEFLRAKGDPLLLKGWVNKRAADAWEDESLAKVNADGLMARVGGYDHGSCPAGVLAVVMAVDVQDTWLEVSVWGYGRGAELQFMLCNDTPTLVYIANLAGLELHPALACAPELASPTMVVFDLDPGPPANLATCCKAALVLRELFAREGLVSVAKTSGNKGMQLYVPLNTPTTYDETKGWARAIAERFEAEHPDLFVSQMKKSVRDGKIFIDWSQNDANKTTISVYSLRARARPTVSTPLSWDEIEGAAKSGDASHLVFEAPQVLERVAKVGDLFAPALTVKQLLPAGPRSATKKRAPRARVPRTPAE